MNSISRQPRSAPGGQSRAGQNRAGQPREQDITAIIRQLTEVITKENTLLRRRKFTEIKPLAEAKEKLAHLYQERLIRFHRNPDLIRQMDPARRAAMEAMAKRLDDVTKENDLLLRANMEAVNRMLQTVVTAVKLHKNSKAAAYQDTGNLAISGNKREMAVSVNQTM